MGRSQCDGTAKHRPREAEVLKAVMQALRDCGLSPERQNTGGLTDARGQYVAFGQAGNLDIRLILPDGRACEIEVKRPGERPRPEQWHRLHTINAQGGVAFWVNDSESIYRCMPRIIAGWRVETDDQERQWITDGEENE